MLVDPKNQVSITEANKNFSKIAKLVDERKAVVILKQNKPKYILVEYDSISTIEKPDEKELSDISRQLMLKNVKSYTELAK